MQKYKWVGSDRVFFNYGDIAYASKSGGVYNETQDMLIANTFWTPSDLETDDQMVPVETHTANSHNEVNIITPEKYLKRFKELTQLMYETTEAKNSDYTADCGDAYQNFRLVEMMNITSVEAGFLTRITDKIARLAGLTTNKECKVKDEKYTDTCLDLANYALLLCIYLENKKS